MQATTLGAVQIHVTHFTDPACPFAFSAEPIRFRLRWHYGHQLVWCTRMIVLTLKRGEAERLASGAPAYETAVANLAPELARRPRPANAEEVLAWAGEPLATAEVALVTASAMRTRSKS